MKVTAVIRTTETRTIEGEGPRQRSGPRPADELVPEGFQVLSYSSER